MDALVGHEQMNIVIYSLLLRIEGRSLAGFKAAKRLD